MQQTGLALTPRKIPGVLLDVATVRPVYIWSSPGLGKTALVRQFADGLGMPLVSLLGTQLAAEDISGVPQITPEGKSRFCPPEMIARNEPYVLFLDELNGSSHDVQKSMYSLVLERRVGEYELPQGSVVIGAGNRANDNAITRPMSSALINRMIHIHLRVDAGDWLEWGAGAGIHPWVLEYVRARPDHIVSPVPKTEETFTTPRSWHALSDVLHSLGAAPDPEVLNAVAHGSLSARHAASFLAWTKTARNQHALEGIIKGRAGWPGRIEDRDLLYFLAEGFRAKLGRELPKDRSGAPASGLELAHRAKDLLVSLAEIHLETAQMVIAADEEGNAVLPGWFLAEVVRDLPRLFVARQ